MSESDPSFVHSEAVTSGASPEAVGLDPSDWEAFRAIGHSIFDDMVDYLRDVRDRPAWQSPSSSARVALSAPVPRHGRDLVDVYADFKRNILPYPTGNIHPRFWGWVMGNGSAAGLLADMLASTMNCNVTGYDQAASLVERQVMGWLAALLEFPADSSGLLVSGGTAANLVGVAAARGHATGRRVRREGVDPGRDGALTMYGSSATHGWAERTCDLLGLGETAFRRIPTDADHRVDVDALARRIEADRGNGERPICIVGNAGTVACGATDDLNALADLAAEQDIWFHVDGAFGALAKLSPRYRQVCEGLERADSVAFDLHKWGYMQYEAGAVLLRDPEAHTAAFSFAPSYLEQFRGGIAIQPTEFASRGVQLSRGFRALRVWMHLSTYGCERIGALIEQNIDDVQYLKDRVEREPWLERLGPAALNVLCFRFVDRQLSEEQLECLNCELLVRLQESGFAVPSSARVDGRFALRVANTNHRTRRADFDALVNEVLTIGGGLARAQVGSAGGPPDREDKCGLSEEAYG